MSGVMLFFDFDGTLSPIVKDPGAAFIPDRVKGWLKGLTQNKNCRVAIVTGRSLKDVRNRVGLKEVIYASNHGMEVFYRGRVVLRKGAAYKKPLARLEKELAAALSGISRILVENKGLSLAVHLRRVDKRCRKKAEKTVSLIAGPWLERYGGFRLSGGKMLLEVRPSFWNKGSAVLWIWKRFAPRSLPVYAGDDVTDEDAFLALRPYGLTIRIGRKITTHAEFQLPSIDRLMDSGARKADDRILHAFRTNLK